MVPPLAEEEPASLLGVTVRRAMVSGRTFLIYGTAISVLLGVSLSLSAGNAFSAAFPILLPIFATTGSMGGLLVFSNDRQKGVLEYLIAYGISPRRLFFNVLLTSWTLATIVLGVATGVGLGVFLARGHALSTDLVLLLGLYGIPMGYASAAFAVTVGMYWTSLSSPRTGMNSPIGLIPMIGILPSLATIVAYGILGAARTSSSDAFLVAAVGMMGGITVVVVLLLSQIGRLLRRERLLSPI